MTKITAEQVLAHFESLPRDQKQLVSSRIFHLKKSALPRARHTKSRKNISQSEVPTVRFETAPSSHGFPEISTKQAPTKKRSAGSYQVLMDGEVIEFEKGYLETHKDLWWLEALVGSQIVMHHLKEGKHLDDQFIEEMIEKGREMFYLNERQDILFSTNNELIEFDFGKLVSLKPLEALQRFGLQKMEEASEKLYAKI